MENRVFVGIDPGKSGGVSILYNNSYNAIKCPNTVQEMAMALVSIKGMAPDIPIYACIESVHSMPGQGVKSTFTFGQGYGQWLGILATLKIPYIQVTPHKWMKHFGPMPKEKKDRKNHLKHLAQQRYPNVNVTLAVADALLIATYLKETNKQ
jgi:hypothetical protein